MLTIQSCTTDQEPVSVYGNELDTTISHMVVKYGDRIYETDVKMIGDSVVYLNDEYADIYKTEISKMPDNAAMVSSDESGITYVEYFVSEKELLDKYDCKAMAASSDSMIVAPTRGGTINLYDYNRPATVLANAEMYDDKNFKDTQLLTYATDSWQNSVPKLSTLGFNDKCSSIKVYNRMSPKIEYRVFYYELQNGVLTGNWRIHRGSELRPVLKCYHNSNYSGSVIYCIAPVTGSTDIHSDTNLKSIDWNDRISSIEWLLVYNFSVFQGENPEIPAHKPC